MGIRRRTVTYDCRLREAGSIRRRPATLSRRETDDARWPPGHLKRFPKGGPVGRDLWEVRICDHTPGGRPLKRRNIDTESVKESVRVEPMYRRDIHNIPGGSIMSNQGRKAGSTRHQTSSFVAEDATKTSDDSSEQTANARLIAAAPERLGA